MLHYFPPCELGLVNIVSSVSPLLRKFASLDFLLVPKWNASSQRCYLCRLTNWITILPNVASKFPRQEHGWLLYRGPLVLSIVCLLYRNYFLLTAVVRSCYWNGSKRRSVNLCSSVRSRLIPLISTLFLPNPYNHWLPLVMVLRDQYV